MMTKSELRKLIIERFSQSELDSLMFDFCERHSEVQYFGYVHGSYESQVSQLLLSLSDELILKLEHFIYLKRDDIFKSIYSFPQANQNLSTVQGIRDAILIKYRKEQELNEALFGYFDWENLPTHLSYNSKVQELIKHFNRRSMLPQLVEWLNL